MKDKRLYHSVADKVKQLIHEGKYPPGSRLPGERELAEQFGVSRVTIREAEIALQALGYVTIKTGSGVYVSDLKDKNGRELPTVSAFELTEARLMFESEAAALAASQISDDALDQLDQLVKGMHYGNPELEDTAQEADRQFHLTIAEASGNRAVQFVIETLWQIRNELPDVKSVHAAICEVEDVKDRYHEHAAVLDALRARDPAAARGAMREHFSRLLESMIDVTEEKAVEELRKKAKESRMRYLSRVGQHQIP